MEDQNFTFRGQRPHETVRLVIRRHPIVFFGALFRSAVALAFAIAAFVYFDLTMTFYIVGILAILYIIPVLFKAFFLYNNSFCLVTNERIINMDQRGIFDRLISETEIGKIQDVSNYTEGPIKTMLNCGNVAIQTAGAESKILIKNVADPYEVQQEITKWIK